MGTKTKINFRKSQEISSGGNAQVLRTEIEGGGIVACRILHQEKVFKPSLHLQFKRGIKNHQALPPHMHIALCIDSGYQGMTPYQLLEYIEGRSLKEMLYKKSSYLTENSLEIIRQLAEGLAHIHRNDYIHLDIKPENILFDEVSENPILKIIDFDLCIKCKNEKKVKRAAGTANYMAPELLKKKIVSKATDVFAFGVIAYQVLTGKQPFTGATMNEVLKKQIDKNHLVEAINTINLGVKKHVNDILMKCLVNDPAQRMADMVLVKNALKLR